MQIFRAGTVGALPSSLILVMSSKFCKRFMNACHSFIHFITSFLFIIMEDLLALFQEQEEGPSPPSPETNNDDAIAADNAAVDALLHSEDTNHNNPDPTPTNADADIGIRLTERHMSSVDLMDLIHTMPHVSTAALAAMSWKHLNQLLVDPAIDIGPGSVQGKTSLLTIGTVFEASGTRLTSKGNAFCKVTLGTLRTGPCVTVLLFGSAYKKALQHKRCQPGSVWAVLNPRLMPANNNNKSSKNPSYANDTSIAVSVNEDDQMLYVGIDRDYGRCMGSTGGRNELGQWIPHFKQCSCFVDVRQGPYCRQHREEAKKQGNSSQGTTSTTTSGKLSKLQALRQQPSQSRMHQIVQKQMNQTTPMWKQRQQEAMGSTKPTSQSQQMLQEFNVQRGVSTTVVTPPNRSLTQPPRLKQPNLGRSTQQASLNNHNTQRSSLSLPSTGGRGPVQSLQSTRHTKPPPPSKHNAGIVNPYAKTTNPNSHQSQSSTINKLQSSIAPRPARSRLSSTTHNSSHSRTINNDTNSNAPSQEPPKKRPIVVEDLLGVHQSSKKTSKTSLVEQYGRKKKARRLNTDTTGFDGMVAIPRAKTHHHHHHRPQSMTGGATGEPRQDGHTRLQHERILEQQAVAAERRVKNSLANKQASLSKKRPVPSQRFTNSTSSSSSNNNNLFSVLDSHDLERASAAKGRMADEVEAEEYAIRRRKLVDLEQTEARNATSQQKKSSSKGKQSSSVHVSFYCQECRRSFEGRPPMSCLRQKHAIVQKRKLQSTKVSRDDARQALSDKAAEDGGLVLGSGLHWSKFPSSRFNS